MIKAPFPYFGGKSAVAAEVWRRFGRVANFVDPFCGSLAPWLCCPYDVSVITVNDASGFISNFWRALRYDPEAVAEYADWPVFENDLHARHSWLVENCGDDFVQRLEGDPEFYDVKVAGWWVWGMSCWIGGGFCSAKGPWKSVDGKFKKVGGGVNRQRPHLGDAGQGVNRQLSESLQEYFQKLSKRLRKVRVCCGDWSRVCGPSVTTKHGVTAVFLDPPYLAETRRDMGLYEKDSADVAHDVREWAIANGVNKKLRIALCGYDDEHSMPGDWSVYRWSARGGMSNNNKAGNDNRHRETIWFSPYCLNQQQDLFEYAEKNNA